MVENRFLCFIGGYIVSGIAWNILASNSDTMRKIAKIEAHLSNLESSAAQNLNPPQENQKSDALDAYAKSDALEARANNLHSLAAQNVKYPQA